MSRLLPVMVAILPACWAADGDDTEISPEEYPAYVCGSEVFTTQPANASSVGYAEQEERRSPTKECWVLEIDGDAATEGRPFRLTRASSPGVIGDIQCELTGETTGEPIRGNITEGWCTIVAQGGYVRFTVTKPSMFDPVIVLAGNTLVEGAFVEVRDGGVIVEGRAFLGLYQFYRSRDLSLNPTPDPDLADLPARPMPSDPLDPYASCASPPRCFTVDFAGRGTLLEGSMPPCENTLAQFADPFSVIVDGRGEIAFAETPPAADSGAWITGAAAIDKCATRAFTGQRPGDVNLYTLEWDTPTPTMTMDITALTTSGPITSVCRSSWSTSLVPCQ